MLKRVLLFPKQTFDYIWNCFLLKFFNIVIGNNWCIRGKIFIRNHGKVTIGDSFIANCDLSANPVGGPYKSAIVIDQDANLVIGNNVGISGTTIICCDNIQIDDNVMIGSGSCIYDTDFHSVVYEERMNKTNTKTGKVHICEGVFIGARSFVLKGVTIGKHSVIGAGSVVTKSIPDNEVWAGNPAKYIRKIEPADRTSSDDD